MKKFVAKNMRVTVDKGIIISLDKDYPCNDCVDLGDLSIYPGLIDIHVHGGNGFDTMDCKTEAISAISEFKLNEGVTTFFPTTLTVSMERIGQAAESVAKAKAQGVKGAKIGGIFFEGPFISKTFKGAHPEEFILNPTFEEFCAYADVLINKSDGLHMSVAIAPEIENSHLIIKYLTKLGINVRIGHSAADFNTATKAIESGASIGIHTFNAMSQMSSGRTPNMVGTIMNNPDIFAEVICDFVHVHPVNVKNLWQCKGDKTILITDCMCAGGLKDGDYMLGELEVTVSNSIAKLKGTDTLAGSTLNLLQAVKNMSALIPFDEAIKLATEAPAKAMGIFDKVGSIEVSKCADFCVLDNEHNLKEVYIDGEMVLRK